MCGIGGAAADDDGRGHNAEQLWWTPDELYEFIKRNPEDFAWLKNPNESFGKASTKAGEHKKETGTSE